MNARSFRLLLPLLALTASAGFAADVPPPAAAPTEAYPLETYTSVGASFARNTGLAQLGWNEEQFNAFVEGMRATFRGKQLPFDERARRLQESIAARIEQMAQPAQPPETPKVDFTQPARLQEYMKRVAKEHTLQISDSGLAYGLGPQNSNFRPGPDDTVVLSCQVVSWDQQTMLPQLGLKEQRRKVSELVPGLGEGVQMMVKGGSAIFVIPPDLSYGSGKWPDGVERGTPLIYMVKLDEIITPP